MRAQGKLFFGILIAIVGLLLYANTFNEAKAIDLVTLPQSEAKQVMIDSSYKIIVPGGNFVGSAVVIGEGILATAAHVVKDQPFVELYQLDKGEQRAIVVYVDEKTDVAILYADVSCPCPLIARNPTMGSNISVVGYPGNSNVAYISQGTLSAHISNSKYGDTLHRGTTYKGMSGGGVFIDSYEKTIIVGITSSIAVDHETKQHLNQTSLLSSMEHIINGLYCTGDLTGVCLADK